MSYGGLYFKFQTEAEAERVASCLPRIMEHYVTRHKTWDRGAHSDWAPHVERDGTYVLVPGSCSVSLLEYGGSSEKLEKGEALFMDVSCLLANNSNIGDFEGQCCRRSEGFFGGDSIACSCDERTLEFRIMSGWTRFCDVCAAKLKAADGTGRPEPELCVIRDNPVALLNPTASCVYEGDCNLQVQYQRWGRVKDEGIKKLRDTDTWDERAGMWRRGPYVPARPKVYRVRIGNKTYRLRA